MPGSVFGLLDGNGFTNESAANVNELASPFDLAVGATWRTAASAG
ncbi:hypothetical protein [Bradyrhizobium sp. CCBAU 65884]|nr:hypothetical protein [Bradyrhizobium sp. CCBAU 65884]